MSRFRGVAGKLLDPVVRYEADRIVITIDAAPRHSTADTCVGRHSGAVTVLLSEPAGRRALADCACLVEGARSTAPCLSPKRLSIASLG